MLSGTRSALAPCRPGPSGARMAWAPFSDGLQDFGEVMAAVFAYGMTGRRGGLGAFGTDGGRQRCGSIRIRYCAAPCRPTRALCRHHTSIFLPHTASGRSACTLAAKFSNASRACGSDFVRAHRKVPRPERGKLPACRAFLHRHTQAPFGLALQTDVPPADNTVRFRTGACADARGKRGLPRRVEERVVLRQAQAKPVFDDLKTWLQQQVPKVSGKSKLAEAIRYTLSRTPRARSYLSDGRPELGNNICENSIRPIAKPDSFCISCVNI